MTRLNVILYFALMFSALGLVNAQHKARKFYVELEQLNQEAKQFNQEYGQLQLEQSTWAMHSRVELIAAQVLQMQVPDSTRIQVVSPDFKGDLNAAKLPGLDQSAVLKPGTGLSSAEKPKAKPANKAVPAGAQL